MTIADAYAVQRLHVDRRLTLADEHRFGGATVKRNSLIHSKNQSEKAFVLKHELKGPGLTAAGQLQRGV